MWLALPHDREEWGRYFDEAYASVVRLANTLARTQEVNLLVPEEGSNHPLHERVTCHAIPYGDIWLRDTGPILVHRSGALEAVTYAFNGWGGKFLFDHDPDVARRVAGLLGVPCRSSSLAAEGGALDSNGLGTFLSTRECLLNENRNPSADALDVERELAATLGCRHVIWVERGLDGDHTDGHVDNVARFVGPHTVACMEPCGHNDPNRDVLLEVHDALRSAHTADGNALEIVSLPSPGGIEGPQGIMAASYCNFLIANRVVIVPTFDVDQDAKALSLLAAVFPERQIVPHPAYALLTGGGTVHCISQQEPRHE